MLTIVSTMARDSRPSFWSRLEAQSGRGRQPPPPKPTDALRMARGRLDARLADVRFGDADRALREAMRIAERAKRPR